MTSHSSDNPHDSGTGSSAPSTGGGPDRIEAGRVGRAHGLDGSFYVTGALPRLLPMGAQVRIAEHETAIERRAGTDQRPILRVQGVASREAAEGIRGTPILVHADAAPPLAADEFWAHELAGCDVMDGPRQVGVVRRLIELPSCEALEVAREGHADLLVPLVRDAVRAVDVKARRIEIDLRFLGEGES